MRILRLCLARAAYVAPGDHQSARQAVLEIFDRYTGHLRSTNQMDFPTIAAQRAGGPVALVPLDEPGTEWNLASIMIRFRVNPVSNRIKGVCLSS